MKDADFRKCLALGEGTSIEFKRCGNVPGEDTFETICSFANRQGGSVFLGVEKDGTVIGVAENNIEGVERNIVNVINNPKMFNIPPAIELERIAHEGMTVIRAWVPISSIVHSFKNVVYDRIADVDIRVKTDAQLAAMYIRKQEYYSEQKIFPFLSEEDLRLDLIPRIRQMALAKRADHPWAT
ncbi:MAG: putative DNA binding domain-containing protein, partial [Eggerthellaceae bacterium]|nr:putative DNA binding domain-containing protein [Eggerthellaceae bacterium]